ncbi:MAG: hypothetical protein IPN34_23145 [Planctomycetes bacterium]|nr:hypothetical protein [Planctomycetota bacterium]
MICRARGAHQLLVLPAEVKVLRFRLPPRGAFLLELLELHRELGGIALPANRALRRGRREAAALI